MLYRGVVEMMEMEVLNKFNTEIETDNEKSVYDMQNWFEHSAGKWSHLKDTTVDLRQYVSITASEPDCVEV